MPAKRAVATKPVPTRLAGTAGLGLRGKRCVAVKRNGERCGNAPLHGKKRCPFHSGDTAKILGARGGRRRAVYNPENLEPFAAPQSAMDLVRLLGSTIVEVRSGRLDPRVANSLSYVSGAFMAALETADLEARLTALESRHSALEDARKRVN